MSGRRRRILKRDELSSDDLEVARMHGRPPGDSAEPPASLEPRPEQASPEVDRTRRLVQAMLSGFARQRRDLLTELQPYVVRIAVEVARRIVRRELRTDPGMVARTVGAALEQVASASQTRVRVHPLDAQVLQESIREIVPAPDEAAALEIVPDGSIERGGCVVESDRGIVDARLQTQFEEMQGRLLDGLEETRSQRGDGS
jgi:flagellar assembly protein FliH